MISSLNEAILHAEEVAERLEGKNGYAYTDATCEECANEHRQLAEWLKELKAYRDGCHCDTCKYLDKNSKNRPCGYCGDNESNWEYARR